MIERALAEAETTLDDITAIGVTYGPGLVGALLVGVAEAKAIAYAARKPLIGVHHIEGHVSANFIENKDLEPPFICLIVSGGHTHLVVVKDYGELKLLAIPEMMLLGKLLIKWPVQWDWGILVVQRLIRQQKKEIPMLLNSQGVKWQIHPMILASVV